LPQSLNDLENSIGDLEETLSRLIDSISPVSIEEPPSTTANHLEENFCGGCDYSRRIAIVAGQIRKQAARAAKAIDLLDI
jgi:hypothetical protein